MCQLVAVRPGMRTALRMMTLRVECTEHRLPRCYCALQSFVSKRFRVREGIWLSFSLRARCGVRSCINVDWIP